LALTPQNNDAFFREVDDNLRQDQMIGAARRWGPIIAGVILLLLVLLAGFLFWRDRQARQAGLASEALNPALARLESNLPPPDPAAIQKLAEGSNKAYSTAARFALADSATAKGDTAAAARMLLGVAGDSAVPQPQRDLALIRATLLQYDGLAPNQTIDRLKGLAIQGNPWFASAGELTALAWLKLNRKDKAGPLFAAIANDPSTPGSIRGRAAQMATNLGQTVAPRAAPAL
jgi:hypothetical protein